MSPRTPLPPETVQAELASLPGWRIEDGKLQKTFVFEDFVGAFGFMTRVALAAEAMDHHPEWCNIYKTVTVKLVTHDVGAITQLDINLAHTMERYAK